MSFKPNELLSDGSKTVLYAHDITGKKIEDPVSFRGILIISYSDGSKKKVFK